jgi:predicted phage terminase large subunit-like protein
LLEHLNPSDQQEILQITNELDRRDAVNSLAAFARVTWQLVEPNDTYVHNWHIDAMAEHLEAVYRKEIRNLIINVPPRHMKSLMVSVLFPSWVWSTEPGSRWLNSSYAQDLSLRDALKMRRIVESKWYREFFIVDWQLSDDQNKKEKFENTRGGYRISTGVGGKATGEGGDYICVDDPHNASEANSAASRKTVREWWKGTMSSRSMDPKTVRKIVIMQRLHEEDLCGMLLEQDNWESLILPTEYDGKRSKTSVQWEDPRKQRGELLWPARLGKGELAEAKKELGSKQFVGQHQQRPAPEGGKIIKREWWRYWKVRPTEWDILITSWDLNVEEGENNAFTVGQAWAKRGPDYFLLGQVREQCGFNRQLVMFDSFHGHSFPNTNGKVVEKKANGAPLIASVKKRHSGVIPWDPKGSKEARAEAISPIVEAGNVYLPDPEQYPWVEDYLYEWGVFPNGKYADQVDTTTQAIIYLEARAPVMFNPVSMTKSSAWKKGGA